MGRSRNTQFQRQSLPAETGPLITPTVLRALADAGILREARLVYFQEGGGWLLQVYHAGDWHTARMWDQVKPRVYRDANSAARQAANIGIAELRVMLATVPDPDVLTRAGATKRSKR